MPWLSSLARVTPRGGARVLSATDISRIRANHRLVDVLARAGVQPPARWGGGDFVISCPLPGHDDATPSMIAHPDTDRYHCFGCGAHGDVLQFVMDLEEINSLSEAAEVLDAGRTLRLASTPTAARQASRSVAISTVERPDRDRTSSERVLASNAEAWRYFTLPRLGERARRYLTQRRIDVRAVESEAGRPLAGHTPRSETALVEHLCRRGFTIDELVDAGWASRHLDGTVADRYRRRLMIPIRDGQDRVVGVYGRDVTGRANAKYLNTPDTAVFNKGDALYRPSFPRLHRFATVIVCEGSLDALAIAAAAATIGRSASYAPVSPSGTVLTVHQARSALALHPGPPVLCGDGDPAGLAATAKWATTITTQHRECLATLLPVAADPADWLESYGPDGLAVFTRNDRLRPDPAPPIRPLPYGPSMPGVSLLTPSAPMPLVGGRTPARRSKP